MDPVRAAVEAGYTRMRPVVMTALAMIIGMLPMALGMGEGGEQNAPLGRAVIGGLSVATVTAMALCSRSIQHLSRPACETCATKCWQQIDGFIRRGMTMSEKEWLR
jgi:Cu/Ag efflux pump CusA